MVQSVPLIAKFENSEVDLCKSSVASIGWWTGLRRKTQKHSDFELRKESLDLHRNSTQKNSSVFYNQLATGWTTGKIFLRVRRVAPPHFYLLIYLFICILFSELIEKLYCVRQRQKKFARYILCTYIYIHLHTNTTSRQNIRKTSIYL
jgi:hypothetical protein